MDSLFEELREQAPSAVWSAGVRLARAASIEIREQDDDEIELELATPDGKVFLITLWPEDDEWDCACARLPACDHVVAAAIALRRADEAGEELPTSDVPIGRIGYRFERRDDGLHFRRVVVRGEDEQPFDVPLYTLQREDGGPLSIGDDDRAVEEHLGRRLGGRIPREAAPKVVSALIRISDLKLDGERVRTSIQPVVPHARIDDAGDAFRVELIPDPSIDEVFANGMVRCDDVLRVIGDPGLTQREMSALRGGEVFGPERVPELVTELIPSLRERRVPLQVMTRRLPQVVDEPPRLLVETSDTDDRLRVRPVIVYGDPPSARIEGDRLIVLGDVVPTRDLAEEAHLKEEARRALGLPVASEAVFAGEEAVAFAQRLRGWKGDVHGSAHESYFLAPPLEPDLELGADGTFGLKFRSSGGHGDPGRVMRAWRSGLTVAPLEEGGWAPLPADWLSKHGARVADLLAARDERGKVAPAARLEMARLAEDLGEAPPDGADRLRKVVEGFEGLPDAPLPSDLKATLRGYQRVGVNWLRWLGDSGMGALLADDMGLGKTLQALTTVTGPTLVVAPTSVLHNWAREAAKFRPGLTVNTYHGPKRALDEDAGLTLTTYALLRLDIEALAGREWDLVVLDESQAIKNPDSQVARAAFRLNAKRRVAMTGTPVENRLEELWSQFHFINRGLLGGREDFDARYGKPIAGGDGTATARLRDRVKPFILRRHKREVAPELPPRTEDVLHVELEASERAVYDAIRAATKKDVVERLRAGGNVIEALEALLRLRQAACHPALVPGQEAETSSKVELLAEVLEEAVSEGHKALVFSQWTSMLDLVEGRLGGSGLAWTRLDGSTRDRGAVVESFEDPDGPPVMLLSLKAGGTGLNLTAADHVFLLDPWWNPAVEDQAADRAYRIGQDKPVFVYRLVAQDTVEERILALQESKRALAEAALGGGKGGASLTRDDLLALLE